jgi:hypothetical protein
MSNAIEIASAGELDVLAVSLRDGRNGDAGLVFEQNRRALGH